MPCPRPRARCRGRLPHHRMSHGLWHKQSRQNTHQEEITKKPGGTHREPARQQARIPSIPVARCGADTPVFRAEARGADQRIHQRQFPAFRKAALKQHVRDVVRRMGQTRSPGDEPALLSFAQDRLFSRPDPFQSEGQRNGLGRVEGLRLVRADGLQQGGHGLVLQRLAIRAVHIF